MAFVNADGQKVSYECSELIEELKKDIKEFGGDTLVVAWCKEYKGIIVYTNYDFIEEDVPVDQSESTDGEFLKPMTMGTLLIVLEEQNEIV